MKDAIFIIPHFGKFNNYFQLFLNSCSMQKHFDFLIITDDKSAYNFPANVMIQYTTFQKFIEEIKAKVPCAINIDRGHKLCDFRPVYGFLFEERIAGYRYWGHCDTDMILGDLDRLVYPLTLEGYDKIFNLGHMTLFLNNPDNNRLFMEAIDIANSYSPIFSVSENCKFDEEFKGSICNIFIDKKKKVYCFQKEAGIYTKSSKFFLGKYDVVKNYHKVSREKNLFLYDNGRVFRCYINENQLHFDEFAYIHLQKRNMKVNIPLETNQYKIIPHEFAVLSTTPNEMTVDKFKAEKKYNINIHYFKLRSKNLKIKLSRIFKRYSKGWKEWYQRMS